MPCLFPERVRRKRLEQGAVVFASHGFDAPTTITLGRIQGAQRGEAGLGGCLQERSHLVDRRLDLPRWLSIRGEGPLHRVNQVGDTPCTRERRAASMAQAS